MRYVEREQGVVPSEARFGGHQTPKDREQSFHATNQTINCGFVSGPDGFPSPGFDLDEKDKKYTSACKIVVSSCIFGSFDFLRRPTSKLVKTNAFWKNHGLIISLNIFSYIYIFGLMLSY